VVLPGGHKESIAVDQEWQKAGDDITHTRFTLTLAGTPVTVKGGRQSSSFLRPVNPPRRADYGDAASPAAEVSRDAV